MHPVNSKPKDKDLEDCLLELCSIAEALRHLGQTLPEEQGGLAFLLCGLSYDVQNCAGRLDDKEQLEGRKFQQEKNNCLNSIPVF